MRTMRERASRVVLLLSAMSIGACAAPRWGAPTRGSCLKDGYRLATATLEGVSMDESALGICRNASATVEGQRLTPTRCRNMCGSLRGEFEVPDATCDVKGSAVADRIRRAHQRIADCDVIGQARRLLEEFAKQLKSGTRLKDLLPDDRLMDAADACGFRSVTVTGGSDFSLIVGANVASGVGFGVKDCSQPRGVATLGFTLGPSAGVDASVQLGFWEATVDGLDGLLWGVTLGVHDAFGVDESAFFDTKSPPGYQGVVVGLGVGGSLEGEVGTAVTMYTENVPSFVKDAGAIITGRATSNGAELGGECLVGTDCKGFRLPLMSGVTCCKRRCVERKRDFANTWHCPHMCRRSFVAGFGTCR